MTKGKFIAYLRVSTQRQGRSGLGIEAQRKAIRDYLNGGAWELLSEYVEIETGKRDDRPKLAEALAACKLKGARLLIAKIDRLSRNAEFILRLQNGQVPFVACDMPEANELTIGVMAVVAQAERKMISDRTKAALQAVKAKGKRLGGYREGASTAGLRLGTEALQTKSQAFAESLRAEVEPLKQAGMSLRQIAATLAERGIVTQRAGQWSADAVRQVLLRLGV